MEHLTKGVNGVFLNKIFFISTYSGNSEAFLNNTSERFKIILFEKGSAVIKYNNKNFIISPPCLMIFDEHDSIDIIEKNNLSYKILLFHPNMINNNFNFENIRNGTNSFSFTEGHDVSLFDIFLKNKKKIYINLGINFTVKISDLIKNIENTITGQKEKYWPCVTRTYLLELLFLFQKIINILNNDFSSTFNYDDFINYNALDVDNKKLDINKILIYIHSNYQKEITVNKLAQIFYTNRTTISKEFKEKTGTTIIKYLMNLRIQTASSILRNSKLEIHEIMEKAGFNDISYFQKIFKKITGYTPSKFRKLNTWITI